MPLEGEIKNYKTETVIGIENNSRNSIEYTDGVIDFMNFRHKDMAPNTKFSKNYL
jgi:hypothetical protein